MTAEVSSWPFSTQACASAKSGPRGLRRPRFSFFRFTCQTARNLAAPSSLSRPGWFPDRPTGRSPVRPNQGHCGHTTPTFDAGTRTWPREHGRLFGHRVNSEGLLKTRHRARRRRAEERVYRRWRRILSTISALPTPQKTGVYACFLAGPWRRQRVRRTWLFRVHWCRVPM